MTGVSSGDFRKNFRRAGVAAAAVGAAATTYMAYEAQWPHLRQEELVVPGFPSGWAGVTILHLSDVHAGLFPTNERGLDKVINWAVPLEPDLVFLTGDVLGDPRRNTHCLDLLARLRPPLGMFAVTGNHEYGLGKGPLARARDVEALWGEAGAILLSDTCFALSPREGSRLLLCGGDYLTAGFGLLHTECSPGRPSPVVSATDEDTFPILLIHQPPPPDSPLTALFSLAFAGHTHGGQVRVPTPSGLRPLVTDDSHYLAGVYAWGNGRLVVSRGLGTSFLPLRLLARPEATIWRLV